MITGREKIYAYPRKLSIWKNRIDCENYGNFPKLDEASTLKTSLLEHITIQLKEHLQVFNHLFKDISDMEMYLIHMDR